MAWANDRWFFGTALLERQKVHLIRFDVSALMLALGCALMVGCATPEVGAPCMPEQIPDNGFNKNEAYVETSSVQCQTRVCLVYQLDGDPDDRCQQVICNPDDVTCVPHTCATRDQVEERVYCSCRCKAPSADFAQCDCPAGYSCKEILKGGGPGVQGSYCVNARTLNK